MSQGFSISPSCTLSTCRFTGGQNTFSFQIHNLWVHINLVAFRLCASPRRSQSVFFGCIVLLSRKLEECHDQMVHPQKRGSIKKACLKLANRKDHTDATKKCLQRNLPSTFYFPQLMGKLSQGSCFKGPGCQCEESKNLADVFERQLLR